MQLLQCDGSIIEICNIVNQYWRKRVKIDKIYKEAVKIIFIAYRKYIAGEKKKTQVELEKLMIFYGFARLYGLI